MVDRAKLLNLVIVAVLGFIYFWRKMKAFSTTARKTLMKLNVNGSMK